VVAPGADVAVAVMVNSRDAFLVPSTLAWEATALAIETRTGVKPAPPLPQGKHVELAEVAGAYPTEYGLITLRAAEGRRMRGVAFDEVIELVPTDRDTFVPRILVFGLFPFTPDLLRNVELSFEVIDGRRVMISHQRGLRVLRGERVQPVKITDAWRARVGTYVRTDQSDDQLRVERCVLAIDDDGLLVARIDITFAPKPLVMVLAPIDDALALTQGLGRYLGETLEADGPDTILLGGFTLRRTPR